MTRRDLARGTLRLGPWAVTGLLLATAVLGACSYKWDIFLSTFQYQATQFVSVVPAVKQGEGYVPACDATQRPDALTFRFNIVGSQGTQGNDQDKSVRPGDLLKKTWDIACLGDGDCPKAVGAVCIIPDSGITCKEGQIRCPGAAVCSATGDGVAGTCKLKNRKAGSCVSRRMVELGGDFSEKTFDSITFDCIEAYPDADLLAATSTCSGLTTLTTEGKQFSYWSYFEDAGAVIRPAPEDEYMLSVAVLLDQSGSMKGYVNKDTKREVKDNSFEVYPQEFSPAGTDPKGYRMTAVKTFLSLLNDNDRAGVFFFNETGGTQVACDAAAPVGTGRSCSDAKPCPDGTTCTMTEGTSSGTCTYAFTNKARDCFSAAKKRTYIDPSTKKEKEAVDRATFTTSSAFTDLVATPSGRTRLWQSVLESYVYLRDSERTPVRHLIVLTDGPETCFAGNPTKGYAAAPDFEPTSVYTETATGKKVAWAQSAPCASTGFEDFLEVLKADLADPKMPKVHVSFLQVQAFGYPDRDPLQQEIACRTGGQYLFVNSNEFAKDQALGKQGLEKALKDALERLRYSLAGTWNLTVELPALTDASFIGREVAIEGTIHRKETNLMIEDGMRLAVGPSTTGFDIPNYDLRGAVRIPCSSDANCTAVGGECRKAVCQAGAVCGPEGLPGALNTQACGGGACCWGACVSCAGTLDELCNCKAAQ